MLVQLMLVMMDIKENMSNLYWMLIDECGIVFSGSWFDWLVVLLKVGSYMLKIDSGFIGDYNFCFVDLGMSVVLLLGQVVFGMFIFGYGVQVWYFDVIVGQYFFFDSLVDFNVYWCLFNLVGQEVFLEGVGIDCEFNFVLIGCYMLIFNGYNSNLIFQVYVFCIGDIGDCMVNINIGQGSDSSVIWVLGVLVLGGSVIDFDMWCEFVVFNGVVIDLCNDVMLEVWIYFDCFSNIWQFIVIKGDDVGQCSYLLWVNSGGYFWLFIYDSIGEQMLDSVVGFIFFGVWIYVLGVIDKINY